MTNPTAAEVREARYWIVDCKTGIAWAMGGAFRDKAAAQRVCLALAWRYQNSDLRVVGR